MYVCVLSNVSLCRGLELVEGVDLTGISDFSVLTTKKLTFSDGRNLLQKAEKSVINNI